MKKIIKLFITIVILWNCTNPAVKDSRLSIDQIVEINNMIIEELTNQDFNFIKLKGEKSKYYTKVKINNIPQTMMIDTGSSQTYVDATDYLQFRFKNINKMNSGLQAAFGNKTGNIYVAEADHLIIESTELKPWPVVLGDKGVLSCTFLHFTSAVIICNPGNCSLKLIKLLQKTLEIS